MLFLFEGTLGEAWLLLPHAAAQSLPLLLVCLLAQALGVWLRTGAIRKAPCALPRLVGRSLRALPRPPAAP